MANSLVVNYGSGAFPDNATRYTSVGGRLTVGNVAANQESAVRDAGVFSNLFAYAVTNTASVTSTFTLQKSQVDTAVTVSFASDETGIKEDTTNTATFANTDEMNFEGTVPTEAGTNELTITSSGVQFTPDTTTNCISFMITTGSGSLSLDSTTRYTDPMGSDTTPNANEANGELRIRASFTASNLYMLVTSNARTTDTIIRSRKSSTDGNQTFTYASGETGAKEDTSNTDSLAAGDDYNYSVTTSTGGGAINFAHVGSRLVSTAGVFQMMVGATANLGVAAGVTSYVGTSGDMRAAASEAAAQVYPRFTFTADELGTFVSTNTTADSTTVITLRDNGGDSSVTVSYSAAETGLKSDTSNTATITSGTDEIDYQIVNNASSGTTTFQWLALLGSTSGGPSASPSSSPSASPSQSPSASPSISPSGSPSASPSQSPSASESPSVSPSASPSAAFTATLKRYNGTAWEKVPQKVYLNGSWQTKPLYYFDGTNWVQIDNLG